MGWFVLAIPLLLLCISPPAVAVCCRSDNGTEYQLAVDYHWHPVNPTDQLRGCRCDVVARCNHTRWTEVYKTEIAIDNDEAYPDVEVYEMFSRESGGVPDLAVEACVIAAMDGAMEQARRTARKILLISLGAVGGAVGVCAVIATVLFVARRILRRRRAGYGNISTNL